MASTFPESNFSADFSSVPVGPNPLDTPYLWGPAHLETPHPVVYNRSLTVWIEGEMYSTDASCTERESHNWTRRGSTLPLCSAGFVCFSIAPGPGGAWLYPKQNIQSTGLRKLALYVNNNSYAPLTKAVKPRLLPFWFGCFHCSKLWFCEDLLTTLG